MSLPVDLAPTTAALVLALVVSLAALAVSPIQLGRARSQVGGGLGRVGRPRVGTAAP